MFRQPADPAPIVEPKAVQDIFVTEMTDAEHIGGGCWRFTFACSQKSLIDGSPERVIAARLVLPVDSVWSAVCFTVRAIWCRAPTHCCDTVERRASVH